MAKKKKKDTNPFESYPDCASCLAGCEEACSKCSDTNPAACGGDCAKIAHDNPDCVECAKKCPAPPKSK